MASDITRVAFYVSAHQDDWQLFMNPPAFADVLDDKCRCVFLHMTAGDAGLGTGTGGRKHPLYLAREHGAELAIRFMADANERPPVEAELSTPTFAGHSVRRLAYRNTVAYFLRLPDGSPGGDGYAATGTQSLKRLAACLNDTMTAVDGSATYEGWSDLCAMLRGLIAFETGSVASIDLHVPETDPALNLNDHSDHVMSAQAIRDAVGALPARWHHHVGYASGSRPENLAPPERDMKCAVYAVTLSGVQAMDHQVSWSHYDEMFVGRNYCRSETQA